MKQMSSSNFGKVAVLLGGSSREKAISLRTGEAVAAALSRQNIDVFTFDPDDKHLFTLLDLKVERVWNALHGRGGEDGQVQHILDYLSIPYTGSCAASSSLAMDKWRSKMIWKAMGLPVAKDKLVSTKTALTSDTLQALIDDLSLPLFIKPSHEGSSVGIGKVNDIHELETALLHALTIDSEVLVEEFIDGMEYTYGILDGAILPSIRMETERSFYDYKAKYESQGTRYYCPSGLNEEEEKTIHDLAQNAFSVLGCSGWGRVDFIRKKQTGDFILLEVNTIPGMTETSLVPKAAKEINMDFDQLCIKILETSFERGV